MDYYYQGNDLADQGDYDAAIEVFNTGLAEHPDSYALLDRRANTYRRKGENEKALADYTRMTVLKPRDTDGWNSRGCLYQELGEYDKAIADFTACIPLSPEGYGTYWSNRGIAYYEKGDYDAALADLNKSIETWSDPACTDWPLLWRGYVWEKKGDEDRALADFTLAATRNPRNDDAFAKAGYIWFMRDGEEEKAIECYSAAIAARDDVADYWLARGASYWNKYAGDNHGKWFEKIVDLALDDFTKAIELSPDMAAAYYHRGSVRCFKAREFNNLIKGIAEQKALAEAKRAVMLAQLEHIGGAELLPQADALLRGLRSNRDEVDVLMAQAAALMATDDAQEAIEDLSRAIALDPGIADAYYERGLAYALISETDKALADFNQACALDPNHRKAAEKRAACRGPEGAFLGGGIT
jgi:tetratricopeptide (TPR) repeat protein